MVTTPVQPGRRRRICSYDRDEVPADCYLVREAEGEMYFCNSRCLCLWAAALVTKPNCPKAQITFASEMTTPTGIQRRFDDLLELAQWAAANALKGKDNPWIQGGTEIFRRTLIGK